MAHQLDMLPSAAATSGSECDAEDVRMPHRVFSASARFAPADLFRLRTVVFAA